MFTHVENASNTLNLDYRNPKGNREIVKRDVTIFLIYRKIFYDLIFEDK